MSYLETKAIASCFYECYNRKDIEKSFNDFIADDLVNHTMNGELNRDEWMNFDKSFVAACPDLEITIKEQFAEGNRVVTHWACTGTHTGDFLGMPGSGNPIRLTGISIDTIEKGKIKEHFAMADFTHFMQQFAFTGKADEL
jgi:steroid delta-isomerase-like uncharacterized protein